MAIAIIVVDHPRPDDPLGPDIVQEFDMLLTALDVGALKPAGWDRLKVILTIATLEAADSDSGAQGYERAVAKWRVCRFYDGHE